MIVPSDKDYQETKLIKLGKNILSPLFQDLADWISLEYKVKVLNIYFDLIKFENRPRLNVIFEFEEGEKKFREGKFCNFDSKKQKIIAKKFKKYLNAKTSKYRNYNIKLLDKLKKAKIDMDNLLVIFSSFEPIAKIEANESIPEKKIKKLEKKLDNKDLWTISRCFSETTFFFFTDEQVKKYKSDGTKRKYTDKYFKILKRFDTFNYFKNKSYSINFDSKENFDKNYESNWYYYYK